MPHEAHCNKNQGPNGYAVECDCEGAPMADSITLDGTECPITSYVAFVKHPNGLVAWPQFETEPAARLFVEAVVMGGGEGSVHPVVDTDPYAQAQGYADTSELADEAMRLADEEGL